MAITYKEWTGTVAQAQLGIPLTDFDGGWCIFEGFDIFGAVSGVAPLEPSLSLIIHPGTEVCIGSDSFGAIGGSVGFTSVVGDYHTYFTSNGNVTFPDGPAKMSVRLECNFVDLDAVATIVVAISPGFPLDQYIEDPLFLPPFGDNTNPGVEHFINLGWSSQYEIPEETGFEVQRSLDAGDTWDTMALVPREPIIPEHTIELPYEEGAIYRIRSYDAVAQTYSPWSTGAAAPEEDEVADLLHFPTGGMQLGTVSVGEINVAGPIDIVLYSDPSGLYTIVENQWFDRLYNRATGEYIDVAIPNPFVKTGYIP